MHNEVRRSALETRNGREMGRARNGVASKHLTLLSVVRFPIQTNLKCLDLTLLCDCKPAAEKPSLLCSMPCLGWFNAFYEDRHRIARDDYRWRGAAEIVLRA